MNPARYSILPGVVCLLLALAAMPVAALPVAAKDAPAVDRKASRQAVGLLRRYLADDPSARPPLAEQAFAETPLTRKDAEAARELLWDDHAAQFRQTRTAEMKARVLSDGDLRMPFFFKTFGKKPQRGRSLFISMHGGGGTAPAVNDQQWENQKRLYEPAEGVYVAPRAPTNHWNLWHEPHIDRLFARLIEDMIVLEQVDSNRVYLLGYSAGGDGAYQLAPRMADRWAAVAMMAGHPGDASPLSLRNLGFALQVGGKDAAYDRNKLAHQWEEKLARLRQDDPQGYLHMVKIYPNKGHWMDREDAIAIPWMAKQTRNPYPQRIVWKQDDVTHAQSYWLAVEKRNEQSGALITADRKGQQITLESEEVDQVAVRLNDAMVNLDRPVEITFNGKQQTEERPTRRIATLAKTLAERGDREFMFAWEVEVGG